METNQLFHTLHPSGRKGIALPIAVYETLRTFIVASLERSRTTNIQELLAAAVKEFGPHLQGNTAYSLLVVKLDLEARKIIRPFIARNERKSRGISIRLSDRNRKKETNTIL